MMSRANGESFELPESYESRGTIRFLGMAAILQKLLFTSRFVMIDELESSMHYELLSYFLRVFLANSENTSQLLFTTHDINLLNEDFIRRDAVWFACSTWTDLRVLKLLELLKSENIR